jgi:hypothetical protein
LKPHHVATIRALDAVWIEHVMIRSQAKDARSQSPSSMQGINPAAFDAVFG